ncbi:MAG: glycosyl hydrolase family 28 protein [Opitutaceae bacterium]|jgi:polygalacturonase
MLAFSVRNHGARGDGVTDDTAALSSAALACRAAGGGVLHVPPGDYLTGIFEIFSNTTLQLDKGARLLGSPQLDAHRRGDAVGGILFACDANDIAIQGEGMIDGNGAGFFREDEIHLPSADYDTAVTLQGAAFGTMDPVHGPLKPKARPGNLIVFAGCRNVRLEGFHITGAPYWTLHLADCEDVVIRNLHIENDPRHPNNDGIHLTTCRRALIEDCFIHSGDDSIALTGFKNHGGEMQISLGLRGIAGVCGDITIRRCDLSSRSSGIRIGYGHNPVRGVLIEDIVIHDSNRGICICARQSPVEDITIRRVKIQTRLFHGNWWGRGEPLHITALRYWGDATLHTVKNIRVENIEADSENGIHLFAEDPGAVDGVSLTDVTLTVRSGPLHDIWGGNFDLRPAAARPLAIHAGGNAPLWSHNVSNLSLTRTRFTLDPSADGRFTADEHIG